MKKQTAVEWLFAHLLPFLEFSDPKEREHFRKCLAEAKSMEREQIVDSIDYCRDKYSAMDLYCTEIKALSPHTGELKTYLGPEVPGISFSDAQNYCENNGLGYCKVIGLLVAEIPCKDGSYEPDWSQRVDYNKPKLN